MRTSGADSLRSRVGVGNGINVASRASCWLSLSSGCWVFIARPSPREWSDSGAVVADG